MALSKSIHVASGVRQGRVLSPSLFNIFINAIIMNVNLSGYGCHINNTFLGCAVYADDLIISASQSGLQAMLDVCVFTCESLSLKFNAQKNHAVYVLVENIIRNFMILC